MRVQFYKPNPKETGSACSFWQSEDGSIMSSLIKQDSWDGDRRIGSFAKNKDNPSKKVNIKFSPTEIAGIIDALESNREFGGYHGSNQIVKFKFSPYLKDGKQIGFSYSVNKESKEDSTDKTNFIIGFSYPEARLLIEHLSHSLRNHFKANDAAASKYTAPSKPSQAPESKGDLLEESDDSDVW